MKIILFIIMIPLYIVLYVIKGIIYLISSLFIHKNKENTSSFDKESDIYNLSDEERKIAKKERMSPSDYIEAEERDDENLDSDE